MMIFEKIEFKTQQFSKNRHSTGYRSSSASTNNRDIDSLKLREIKNVIRKQSELNMDRSRSLNKSTSDAYRIDELDEYINSIEPTNQKINLGVFNIIKLLGRGGFGKVSFENF